MTATGGAESPDPPFADEALAVTTSAYAREPDSWESAVEAAIGGLFDFLASRPTQTRACMVDGYGGGPGALARRDRLLERFADLLRPGLAATSAPPVVAEAIAGGIYELVRGYALERRLSDLPAAAPDATTVALAPFTDRERSGAASLLRGPTPPIAFPAVAQPSDASDTSETR